jgi:hypothetical protein
MHSPIPRWRISIAVTGEALTSVDREEFCAVQNRYEQRTKARKSRVAVCRSIGTSIGSPVINQAIGEDLLCDNQSRVNCQQQESGHRQSHLAVVAPALYCDLLSVRHPILDIAAGHSFRVTAGFRASELLGLPSTADRDKFLALMKLVSEERARVG